MSDLTYVDGDYSEPYPISRTPREYPFAQFGDLNAAVFTETYLVDDAAFVPTARGTVHPRFPGFYVADETKPEIFQGKLATFVRTYANIPDTQVVPSTYALSKPSISGPLPKPIGSYVVTQPNLSVQRFDAYARQIALADSGPDLGSDGDVTGGTYTISFDGDTTAALAYNASASAVQAALNALTSVSDRGGVIVSGDYLTGFTVTFAVLAYMTIDTAGLTTAGGAKSTTYGNGSPVSNFVQSATVDVTPNGGTGITGGTYAVTLFGQTTLPIAYNASAGTVQAALNALSNVAAHGGVTVPYNPLYGVGQFNLSFGFSYPAFTVDVANLIVAGSTATVTRIDPAFGFIPSITPGRQQSLTFSGATVGDRVVQTVAAHGITTADTIYAKAGDDYFTIAAGNFAVSGTDEITFNADSGPVAAALGAITEIGKRVKEGYEPGRKDVLCKRWSYFYHPGVTPGITSADDIIPPTYQGDTDTLLQAIFAGTGTINIVVNELGFYRGITLMLGVVTIRASDV